MLLLFGPVKLVSLLGPPLRGAFSLLHALIYVSYSDVVRGPSLPVCAQRNLDPVWAWMQGSHQSLLTWLSDGLPDITLLPFQGVQLVHCSVVDITKL